MEQYKVILVDDEVEVIDVMKKKIRWNDLGFDVVGSATNGVKASAGCGTDGHQNALHGWTGAGKKTEPGLS